jgi:hypothetical protein
VKVSNRIDEVTGRIRRNGREKWDREEAERKRKEG